MVQLGPTLRRLCGRQQNIRGGASLHSYESHGVLSVACDRAADGEKRVGAARSPWSIEKGPETEGPPSTSAPSLLARPSHVALSRMPPSLTANPAARPGLSGPAARPGYCGWSREAGSAKARRRQARRRHSLRHGPALVRWRRPAQAASRAWRRTWPAQAAPGCSEGSVCPHLAVFLVRLQNRQCNEAET